MKNATNQCGIVCTGGGSAGAYQVGVLKYIHERFCENGESPFSVFTGVSCGALNACFLASHSFNAEKDILYLEELWRGFHVPAYHRHLNVSLVHSALRGLRTFRKSENWSILDAGPVWDVVGRGFDRDGLE